MAGVAISNAAKWIVPAGVSLWQNWDQVERLFDRSVDASGVEFFGYYLQCVFEMRDTTAGSWTERGSFGTHWINTTGGDPDYTWTNADFSAVETGANTFWGAIPTRVLNTFRLVEHRWYAFGPGVTKPNPVYRTTAVSGTPAGTSTGPGPRQLACAVTLKTALRQHWGRFYVPLSAGNLDAAGRLINTATDAIATAAQAFLNSGSAQGVYPCVYDRNRHTMIGVNQLQVDDVPDIIRRRRPDVTQYRKTIVLP